MKALRAVVLLGGLLVVTVVVLAQTQLSSWPFFVETVASFVDIRQSAKNDGNPGFYQFTVPLHVMGQARDDLGDLRLFDSQNHEIPYAIRVRNEINEQKVFVTHVFNKVTIGSSTEATIDLGENPTEHNEVQIETAGTDFRRRVTIEGSDNSTAWRTLRSDAVILSFSSGTQAAEANSVTYPTSRYRYLRIRVQADEVNDDHAPDITDVRVSMTVHQKGELTKWAVSVPSYQLLRNQGAYASSLIIDLGARVPCDRLSLSISAASFYRPYQVEGFDDQENPISLASGYLSRREGEQNRPQLIVFEREAHVRQLRLKITDYSNPTLSITGIEAAAPARQLLFVLRQPQSSPLRLYFGNQKIPAPHYDFEKEVSANLKNEPMLIAVGETKRNPAYKPEPLPFTERAPWLIYLVLAASSVALGWILFSLAKKALKPGARGKSREREQGQ